MCEIKLLHMLEGAAQAEGLTVIIDVFRAFSLECYLFDMGAKEIRPIGAIEEARRLGSLLPGSVLIGERGGKKVEGFDYGNSPSSVERGYISGKTVLHTTSAGTQGIVNAVNADEIITGSLVNARAIAEYIKRKQPKAVSIVCMGTAGTRTNPEDELCGEYLKSLIEGEGLADIDDRIAALRTCGGEHFFDPERQEIFPEADFWMCIKKDIFPFVIRIRKDELGYVAEKYDV